MRSFRSFILCLLMLSMVATCGCQDRADEGGDEGAAGEGVAVGPSNAEIQSGNRTYPAYLATPEGEGPWPGVVLLHSFGGLEAGYRNITDNLASGGYVVIAPEWLTFEERPSDEVVEGIVRDSIGFLQERDDVNSDLLGLTGFCAGGRYTMLFLPQMEELDSGVAWYGFPYREGEDGTAPADYIDDLDDPMLIIHGTADQASNVTDIYRYAEELDAAGKYFEMKIYQGEPHGFMTTEEGELSQSFPAQDAYWQMATFFNRTLV